MMMFWVLAYLIMGAAMYEWAMWEEHLPVTAPTFIAYIAAVLMWPLFFAVAAWKAAGDSSEEGD